jgi:hypothetical protein
LIRDRLSGKADSQCDNKHNPDKGAEQQRVQAGQSKAGYQGSRYDTAARKAEEAAGHEDSSGDWRWDVCDSVYSPQAFGMDNCDSAATDCRQGHQEPDAQG